MTVETERVLISFEAENKTQQAAAQVDGDLARIRGTAASATTTTVGFGSKAKDALVKVAGPAKGAAGAMAAFAAAGGASGSALRAMVGAVSACLGPVGLLVGGVGMLASGFWDQYQAANSAADAIKRQAAEAAKAAREEAKRVRNTGETTAAVGREEATLRRLEHEMDLAELAKDEETRDEKLVEIAEQKARIARTELRYKDQYNLATGEEIADMRAKVSLAQAEIGYTKEIIDAKLEAAGIEEVSALHAGKRTAAAKQEIIIAREYVEIIGGIEDAADKAAQSRLARLEAQAARERDLIAYGLDAEMQAVEGVAGREAEAHAIRMRQITAARDAEIAALDAKAETLRQQVGGDQEERTEQLKQVAHDREMARMQADLEMRRAHADESRRLAEEQQAALQRQIDLTNASASAIESVHGNLSSKLSDWRSGQQAEEAAQLESYVANQNARTQAQTAALDQQIRDATGNTAKQRALMQRRNALERQSQMAVEKARKKHADKSEKIERRQKGISMLLEGALATVRAATAYPNIPEMIAMAAAAAIAFSFGAAVLAGGTPGAGGAGGLAAGGQAGGGAEIQYLDAQKTPGSAASDKTQPQAKKKGEQEGGTTYNGNVTYYANGSIDQDAAEQWAAGVAKASRTREGVTKA